MYFGDYKEDDTVFFPFNTKTSVGPITLAGTPAISIYKDDATGTEVTTGVTLTVDHDSKIGKHLVKVDLSSASFYAVGGDYYAELTAGTVDGISVVGQVVGSFSIENRSDVFDTQMADSVPADGTISTREQALYIIEKMMTEFAYSGTTLTVKKVDGTTTLMTFTLDEATNPTSLTRAS